MTLRELYERVPEADRDLPLCIEVFGIGDSEVACFFVSKYMYSAMDSDINDKPHITLYDR